MAQEIADSTLLDTWGSSGAKIEPDISKIIEGWQLGEQPPHEYMNWLQNTFGSKLNHILKNGVAKWNNETEYLAGATTQHNGSIWTCKTTNTNSEPTSLNNKWEKIPSLENLALTVDTINDFPTGATTGDACIVKDLDRGGIFIYDSTKVSEDNQGTNFNGWIRQYSGAVNVKWFGAKGDGVTDDSSAFNAAITKAAEVVDTISGDIKTVKSLVKIPNGIYNLENPILFKNCVSIYGESVGSVQLLINHAGNGIESTTGQFANIYVQDLILKNAGSASKGISGVGLIRNCVFRNVVAYNFDYGFYFKDSWTTKLENCSAYSSNIHHIFADTGCGGIHIYGGRYDVSASHGIYMNSTAGELLVVDASVQFGQASAVYVEQARTVILKDAFFEGNCIGNPAYYYAHILGDNHSLSSCRIIDCVFNDLGDANRHGDGAVYVDGYDDFVFRERWTRNATSAVPNLGVNIQRADITYSNAGSRSAALTSVSYDSQANVTINQLARPKGIFGRDMNYPSFAPTTYAALNVGLNDKGVSLGTYDQIGALQGYGAGYDLKINPGGGDIYFGQSNASLKGGTNEWFGRFREATQITSSNLTPSAIIGYIGVNCSAGGRSVTLTNITPLAGRTVTVGKTDGTTNALTIIPGTGTINGAASYVLNSAYQHVELISDNTNWFVKG